MHWVRWLLLLCKDAATVQSSPPSKPVRNWLCKNPILSRSCNYAHLIGIMEHSAKPSKMSLSPLPLVLSNCINNCCDWLCKRIIHHHIYLHLVLTCTLVWLLSHSFPLSLLQSLQHTGFYCRQSLDWQSARPVQMAALLRVCHKVSLFLLKMKLTNHELEKNTTSLRYPTHGVVVCRLEMYSFLRLRSI